MTLYEMASTIRNHVADGLSGAIANHAYSIEQLEKEIDLLRAKLLYEYIGSIGTKKVNLKYHMQLMPALTIVCLDPALVPSECAIPSGIEIPAIKMPKILATPDDSALGYIGYIDHSLNFSFYSNIDDVYVHNHRVYTAGTPYAWSDMTTDENGMMTLYLFNLGELNPLKKLTVRAVIEKPYSLLSLDPDALNKEYPSPAGFQEDIIARLTYRYIEFYRKLNIVPQQVPNTQSDPIT